MCADFPQQHLEQRSHDATEGHGAAQPRVVCKKCSQIVLDTVYQDNAADLSIAGSGAHMFVFKLALFKVKLTTVIGKQPYDLNLVVRAMGGEVCPISCPVQTFLIASELIGLCCPPPSRSASPA